MTFIIISCITSTYVLILELIWQIVSEDLAATMRDMHLNVNATTGPPPAPDSVPGGSSSSYVNHINEQLANMGCSWMKPEEMSPGNDG